MNIRSTTQILLTVLMVGVTALVAVPASATGPVVTFRSAPRWETIPGTRVAWVTATERPDYDLFRYGSRFYMYNGGSWYRSDRLNRPFVTISERNVPIAFAAVPRAQWRSYPQGWMNPKNPHYSGRHDNRKHKGQKHSSSNR